MIPSAKTHLIDTIHRLMIGVQSDDSAKGFSANRPGGFRVKPCNAGGNAVYGIIASGLAIMTLLFILAPGAHARHHRAYTDAYAIEKDGTIVDQAGRELKPARPFHRIISLYGAHTENLFALGAGREVIGVARHEVYPPEALSKPVFSYHDDPEKFLAATPDLVLVRPMIDRAYPQLMSRLEKSGITVCSLQPKNVNDLYLYWEILGILTGKQRRAAALASRFSTAIDQFRALSQTVTRPQKVYFEAIHNHMKTFTPQSMAIFALETAGGINIAPDAVASRGTNIGNYGKERILAHAGDIDVFLAQVGVMNRVTIDMIRTEPGFSVIRAVQTGRIHLIDEMIVSRPSFRLLKGIHTIGRILYPEVYGKEADLILQTAFHDERIN